MSRLVALSLSALLTGCFSSGVEPSTVRVSLAQDQALVGEVHRGALTLDSPLGSLSLPMASIGEVEPVEGEDLAGSGDHVRVWLRDGSELVGRWAEPELEVQTRIGGGELAIAVPMSGVRRLQLTGTADVPEDGTFRVQTAFGDDVFIDAAETVLPLRTELGDLRPLLSEVQTLAQEDGTGTWRVTLRTGTALVGTVATDALDLQLRIGPPSIQVPLDDLVSIERMSWDPGLWSTPAPAEVGDRFYSVESNGMRAQKQRFKVDPKAPLQD